MKYCTKCGASLHDDAVICPSCGCEVDKKGRPSFFDLDNGPSQKSGSSYQGSSFTYDDMQSSQNGKGLAIGIVKILMIITILSMVFSAISVFSTSSTLESLSPADMQALINEFSTDPDLAILMEQMDGAQLLELVNTIVTVCAIATLIPLLWVVPMTIKIFKASKNGQKVSTGFKICTLLFANALAGIILLCSQRI